MARGMHHPKGIHSVLGCWVWWATLPFLSTHSLSHAISLFLYFFFLFLTMSSMISSRKRERQKRGIRGDSWVQKAEEQGTDYCCNSFGWRYHSKHSFSWRVLSCPLPCPPPFSNYFMNALHEKLTVWIFKHLAHFTSLNKITSIIKELVFYYDKLN